MNIAIKPEFKSLIPPLSEEEYTQLEASIKEEGCRDSLVLWNGILIDGHNRYAICTKHNIEFKTIQKDFASESDVIIWIIRNQFGRRNLSLYDRSLLALKLEEMLKPVLQEKAKGNQVRTKENRVSQKSAKQKIDTREEIARISNVSHDTITKVKIIESKSTPEQKEKLRSGEESINRIYREIRTAEQKEEQKEIKAERREVFKAKGLFEVIYADPPWKYEHSKTTSRDIENQYPTMTHEDLLRLKVPSAENCILYLWVTAPKVSEAIELINAWGFTYRTCAVWDKEVIGMGYWFRNQHELLFVAVKGKATPPETQDRVSSIYKEQRGVHSKKPKYFRDLITQSYPNERKLELFAREKSEGWEVFGNENALV